jgi:hypothetical protein
MAMSSMSRTEAQATQSPLTGMRGCCVRTPIHPPLLLPRCKGDGLTTSPCLCSLSLDAEATIHTPSRRLGLAPLLGREAGAYSFEFQSQFAYSLVLGPHPRSWTLFLDPRPRYPRQTEDSPLCFALGSLSRGFLLCFAFVSPRGCCLALALPRGLLPWSCWQDDSLVRI